MMPCFSSASIIADADAVLDRGKRIEEFQLEQDVGLDAGFLGHAVHAHQRRVADGFGDGIIDAAAAGFSLSASCSSSQIVKSAPAPPPASTPDVRARWQRSSMEIGVQPRHHSSCKVWIKGRDNAQAQFGAGTDFLLLASSMLSATRTTSPTEMRRRSRARR